MPSVRPSGRIRRPSVEEIRTLAAREYIDLSPQEAADLGSLMDGMLVDVERLQDLRVSGFKPKFQTLRQDNSLIPKG